MPRKAISASNRAGGDGPAFAEERRLRIVQLVNERGRIRNTEIAGLLGVAEPTVRKDVADLASQHLLRRTHGGVIALRPAFEPGLPERVATNAKAKSQVASRCVAMIGDGDAVFLDAGSAILRIAELLTPAGGLAARPKNVNVLTSALPVAQTLADQPNVRHTVLGGTFRPAGACFVGGLTIADLSQFTVNIAFIGISGLSEDGLTVADLAEAQLKRAAMERARKTVIAMDKSKIGVSDFAKVCDVSEVSAIVVDESTEYLEDLCRQAGVELIVAP
jgi:DeoR/GlpR family transcriptional regulator of sugar metabolism